MDKIMTKMKRRVKDLEDLPMFSRPEPPVLFYGRFHYFRCSGTIRSNIVFLNPTDLPTIDMTANPVDPAPSRPERSRQVPVPSGWPVSDRNTGS